MSRRKSARLKPRNVVLSIFTCCAVCLAGIGYVWAKTQVWGLSRDIKKLETRLDELKRTNDALQRTYAAMCTPRELDARVKRLNLGLSVPRPDQILRLPEPVPGAGKAEDTTNERIQRSVLTTPQWGEAPAEPPYSSEKPQGSMGASSQQNTLRNVTNPNSIKSASPYVVFYDRLNGR